MNWEMAADVVNFDAVVFHGQQCIEKILKGILTSAGVEYERTHDPHVLASHVQAVKVSWRFEAVDLAVLQPGAVLLRYPGYSATEPDARGAISACARLRESLLAYT